MSQERDLNAVRDRATATWPLDRHLDEEDAEIAATVGQFEVVLSFGDAPSIQVYDDGWLTHEEPLEDLHAALRMAYAVWRRYVQAVPPIRGG